MFAAVCLQFSFFAVMFEISKKCKRNKSSHLSVCFLFIYGLFFVQALVHQFCTALVSGVFSSLVPDPDGGCEDDDAELLPSSTLL